MIRRFAPLIYLLLLIYVSSCGVRNDYSINHNILLKKYENWGIDTMGCLGLRSQLIDTLETDFLDTNKHHISLEDVINYFGTPEFSFTHFDRDYYVYYIQGKYNDCKLPKDSSEGMFLFDMIRTVDFIFQKDSLVSVSTDLR